MVVNSVVVVVVSTLPYRSEHNIGFMLSGSVLFIWSPIVCTSSLASFWEHVLFASTSVLLMMQSNTSTIYPQNAVVFLADEIVKNKGPIQGSINMFILSTS